MYLFFKMLVSFLEEKLTAFLKAVWQRWKLIPQNVVYLIITYLQCPRAENLLELYIWTATSTVCYKNYSAIITYINYSKSYILITACGGYSLLLEVKECYRLNLNNVEAGWEAIAPLLKGRFNFQLVAAKGLIYAVGGEGPFGDHDDIEVRSEGCAKATS